MRRFKRFMEGRWYRGKSEPDEDTRPYFESVIFFQAVDADEADRLQDAMLEAIGCTDETCMSDEKKLPCKHFRFGSLKVMDDD